MVYALEHGWLTDHDAAVLRPVVEAEMTRILEEPGLWNGSPTRLAEIAAYALDVYGPDFTVPEDLFEWALNLVPEEEER